MYAAVAAPAPPSNGAARRWRPAARAPTRAGDVWEIDHPDDRANAAGAALAYLNGLHVMVVDDNRIADLKLTLQLVDAGWVATHTPK